MRSIHIQKDKTIFKLSELPAEEFAASMGLPGAPQIKLQDQAKSGKAKNRVLAAAAKEEEPEDLDVRAVVGSDNESDEETEDEEEEQSGSEDEESGSEEDSDGEKPQVAAPVRTKYDRMFERRNQSILTPHYTSLISHNQNDDGEDDDDDVFKLARRDHELDGESGDSDIEGAGPAGKATDSVAKPLISSEDLSKRKLKAGVSKKAALKLRPAAEKMVFDDEGNARDFYNAGVEAETGAGAEEQRKAFIEEESKRMREADKVDRAAAREAKREKKRKRKDREREVSWTVCSERMF